MKRAKPKKLRPVNKLIDDAATILQRLVRLKAADDNGYVSCVTCGVTRAWQEMQGGHFLSRTYTQHRLREENIHPQCMGCNGPGRGRPAEYTLYMIDMYGRDFVDDLIATKGQTKKYSRPEIMDLIDDLRERESEIRNLKGF